LETFKES